MSLPAHLDCSNGMVMPVRYARRISKGAQQDAHETGSDQV